MTIATAPGKVILFGEHAVVYGRPAIAVPVAQVRAHAEVVDASEGITIVARDLNLSARLDQLPPDHALRLIVVKTLEHLRVPLSTPLTLTLTSTIPMARGLGSGAAISAACVRALAAHWQRDLEPQVVSALVYEAERIYHGTPSGIDNTVVAYAMPVYFERGQPPQTIRVGKPFLLAIADTGIPSSTKEVVAAVRRAWEGDPLRYTGLFDAIAAIVKEARRAMEAGSPERLGALMDENHKLLCQIGVSSPELDRLVEAARRAGARGAKLSGAGRGGNMLALVDEAKRGNVQAALRQAGAAEVLATEVR